MSILRRAPDDAVRVRGRHGLAGFCALLTALSIISGTLLVRRHFGPVTVDQLLFHLEQGGIDYADPQLLWRAARYLGEGAVVALLASAVLRRLPVRLRRAAWVIIWLGAAYSVHVTIDARCRTSEDDYVGSRYVDPRSVRFMTAADPPDVLMVFVESLDEWYARDSAPAASPVPFLSGWRSAHQTLGRFHNTVGATWTMGGLFSMLCGLPLQHAGLLNHNTFEYATRFFDGGTCLTDVLAAQGWEISFYGGASLKFAGKGKFLARHGVTRLFGREQWEAAGIAVPADSFWGLPDSALVESAWRDMQRPRSDDRPRLHLLLTVNTHEPIVDDPDCRVAADARRAGPMDQDRALACTDAAVGTLLRRFVEQRDGRPKLVWVMGDHVAQVPRYDPAGSPRTVYHALARFDGRGRLQGEPKLQRDFAHVDLLPTLAAAIGLTWSPHPDRLGLGTSLFSSAGSATLLEREGVQTLNAGLACTSPLFNRLWSRRSGSPD